MKPVCEHPGREGDARCRDCPRRQMASAAVSLATTSDATSSIGRPADIAHYVGQVELRRRLHIVLGGASARGQLPPHILLSGPAGFGKTTLGRIVAAELGLPLVTTSAPALQRVGDLAGILVAEGPRVLFVDEIHRLPMAVEEALYEALEDGTLSVTLGQGTDARLRTLRLAPFVLVGATTRPGAMSQPLRDRFGWHGQMAAYSVGELAEIVSGSWSRRGIDAGDGAAEVIARAARGVPRVALHLGERAADLAALRGAELTAELAAEALRAFGVAPDGLDEVDRAILEALTGRFAGKPVGLDNLAQALDLDPLTVEAEHEGYLVRSGLVTRTGRGRQATERAFELVGR